MFTADLFDDLPQPDDARYLQSWTPEIKKDSRPFFRLLHARFALAVCPLN